MTKFFEDEFSSQIVRSALRRRDKVILGERYKPIMVRSGRSSILITMNSTSFMFRA